MAKKSAKCYSRLMESLPVRVRMIGFSEDPGSNTTVSKYTLSSEELDDVLRISVSVGPSGNKTFGGDTEVVFQFAGEQFSATQVLRLAMPLTIGETKELGSFDVRYIRNQHSSKSWDRLKTLV